ncbi:MAG: hypothetical protein ACPL28_00005 [bacterium]
MSGLILLFLSSVLISPELKLQIENAGENERINVIIVMNAEYPYEALENFPVKQKAEIFREIAQNSQRELVDYLRQIPEEVDEIRQFWVFNGLHLNATRNVIELLKKGVI